MRYASAGLDPAGGYASVPCPRRTTKPGASCAREISAPEGGQVFGKRASDEREPAGMVAIRFELYCVSCGYGVVVRMAPESCPMCTSTVWEQRGNATRAAG
jgi:hypothetical protein